LSPRQEKARLTSESRFVDAPTGENAVVDAVRRKPIRKLGRQKSQTIRLRFLMSSSAANAIFPLSAVFSNYNPDVPLGALLTRTPRVIFEPPEFRPELQRGFRLCSLRAFRD